MPSSPGQLELGRVLVDELHAMGISDAGKTNSAWCWPRCPGSVEAPVIAFCSHLDTSPETSGANVKPQVIDRYRAATWCYAAIRNV